GLYKTARRGVERLSARPRSVGRGGVRPLERDEPALALFAGPACEHHLEVEPVDIPRLFRVLAAQLDRERPQQIVGRGVLAVLVLNAAEERELMIRPHVELERRQPGPTAVVDALAVLAVAFAARLPVALEHRARVIGEGTELRLAERGRTEEAR